MATEAPDAARRAAAVVRPAVRALRAYPVAAPDGRVKLDAMENPCALPDGLREEWLDALRGVALNRYPDAAAGALKARLRQVFDIPDQAAILTGNGSDEIIQMLELAIGGPVLAPVPTFVMYETVARLVGAEFVGVALNAEFDLNLEAMLAAIARHRPPLIFIAWPNNPTGGLFDEQAVCRIIEAAPGLVVIDEAYHAFAARSLLDQVRHFPNVLVMRTLSKLGLAGLRLGFAVAAPAWIEQLEKVRMPYNVGVLTQASAAFALSHIEVFDAQAARIRAERERLAAALAGAGYRGVPSDANFILFHCGARDPAAVFQALLDGGVRIKNLSAAHPALAGCLRVTVGTPRENDRFLAALPR